LPTQDGEDRNEAWSNHLRIHLSRRQYRVAYGLMIAGQSKSAIARQLGISSSEVRRIAVSVLKILRKYPPPERHLGAGRLDAFPDHHRKESRNETLRPCPSRQSSDRHLRRRSPTCHFASTGLRGLPAPGH
jgi:hypothetical protein